MTCHVMSFHASSWWFMFFLRFMFFSSMYMVIHACSWWFMCFYCSCVSTWSCFKSCNSLFFFMLMVVHVFHGHGHGHGHGGLSFPRSWSWWFVFSCSWWFMCSIVMHGGSWFSWAWFHVVHGHGFMFSMVIVMVVFVFIFMVVYFFIVMHGVSCFPWSCMCMVSCCSWSWWFLFSCPWWFMFSIVMHGGSCFSTCWWRLIFIFPRFVSCSWRFMFFIHGIHAHGVSWFDRVRVFHGHGD